MLRNAACAVNTMKYRICIDTMQRGMLFDTMVRLAHFQLHASNMALTLLRLHLACCRFLYLVMMYRSQHLNLGSQLLIFRTSKMWVRLRASISASLAVIQSASAI